MTKSLDEVLKSIDDALLDESTKKSVKDIFDEAVLKKTEEADKQWAEKLSALNDETTRLLAQIKIEHEARLSELRTEKENVETSVDLELEMLKTSLESDLEKFLTDELTTETLQELFHSMLMDEAEKIETRYKNLMLEAGDIIDALKKEIAENPTTVTESVVNDNLDDPKNTPGVENPTQVRVPYSVALTNLGLSYLKNTVGV